MYQPVKSQELYNSELKIQELANEIPGLNEEIEISVNGVSIQEFLRGIANNAKININVDPSLNINIINNFAGVKVKDILIFLTKQYSLEITNIGNIISIKGIAQVAEKKAKIQNQVKISYDTAKDLLSYELVNDTLCKVVREITKITGKNVVIPSSINNMIVNGFIQKMPFENVLEKFALTNNLTVEKTPDNFYILSVNEAGQKNSNNNNSRNENTKNDRKSDKANFTYLNVRDMNNISLYSQGEDLDWLFRQISDTIGINYVLVSELSGKRDIKLSNVNYDDFLYHLFEGTKYMYNKTENVYVIGESENMALISTRVFQMQFRSVEKIVDFIPDELRKGVSIKEFPELNSIVLSGTDNRLNQVSEFLKKIDKIVPVILIEVMIVDYNKNHTITTGINAGLGTPKAKSSQTILPGIDYQFSTNSLNNLLSKIDGNGWFNLGKITPDFYLSISALESNGVIKIRSTPKLSTLNGHEALMSSGETKYYKESKSNYYGTDNPSLTSSYSWNPITADLALTITPYVSGDDQITLNVEVIQSEFTTREFDDAPPGSVTRKFKSLIRMKDGEMVLLGGLEKERATNSGTGTPLLSRIPVIKWLFSSKTKSNEDSRLNIFIKPTIVY
jgi:type IV pilus assembly protein PilQ